MIQHTSAGTQTQELGIWSLECRLVYGPVHSRRYGLSLGINLLPEDRKVCNFDCLYCQCGRSSRQAVLDSFSGISFHSMEEIERRIASRFKELEVTKVFPDTITISGNGEPTLHPNFPTACEVVRTYRDRYLRESRIGLLTNGTAVLDTSIVEALVKLDWKSIKLDAGAPWLDRPMVSYELEKLIPVWRQIPDLTIQSFFNEGRLANTQPQVVEPWIEQIQRIRPRRVHIYTVDRKPAIKEIQKASLDCLTRVARQLAMATGVEVEVFD
jgi:wyosine [tRNA(Phe)-imidazoG37] synthetase (radical SAM superfamily)